MSLQIIEGTGFVEVKSEDRSKQMTAFLKRARMKITENLQEYLEVGLQLLIDKNQVLILLIKQVSSTRCFLRNN